MNKDRVIYRKIFSNNLKSLNVEDPPQRLMQGGMFICLKGEVKLLYDDNEYLLKEKSIVVYFPYSMLKILYRSDDLEGILMAVEIESIQPFLSKTTDLDAVLNIRQSPVTILTDVDLKLMLKYIKLYETHLELAKEYANHNYRRLWQLNNFQIENVKTNIILQIMQAFTTVDANGKSGVNRKDEIVRKFLFDLKQFYRKEHEVGFYVNLQYISMRYFSCVVKNRSGKTPSQWIAAMLLTDAKQLLNETNFTIKEIAEMLNFPNQSYFGKWFKTHTGMGPLEFKKSDVVD